GRFRRRNAEIDVGPQRVQRHAAFAVPLDTRDFRAAEPSRAIDADAKRAELQRRLHRALHRTAARDAALELLRNALGDQMRVDFRLADLDDIEMHLTLGELAEVLLQLLDVSALLADHDARACRVDRHAALLVRTLDHDTRDAGLLQLLVEVLAD